MTFSQPQHHLLILSKDHEAYLHLIGDQHLPGLSIRAAGEAEQALDIGAECDLLFGEPALVSQVVNQMPRLSWLQTSWAGVEPLLSPVLSHNYLLTNARQVYGSQMAEYVFGYLLTIERQIIPRWQAQSQQVWDRSTPGSLRGKLLGLLGVGSIGSHLALTAKHFNMRVYGFTRQSESCKDIDQYFHGIDYSAFTSDLDYLVCTLRGTQRTEHLVDSAFLSALPHKAWLINIGRGSTIDEPALITALNTRSISGAILDVFTEEPLPRGHPLWSTPNTFISSHTAARNYLPDIANLFINNYRRYVSGLPLLYQVDFDLGY